MFGTIIRRSSRTDSAPLLYHPVLPVGRRFASTAVAALVLAGAALVSRPAPADVAPSPGSIAQTRPVDMTIDPQTAVGGTTVNAAVSVDTTGGSIQVGCDQPALAASPTGSWPYSLSFPQGGSTTQYPSYSTSTVSSTTTVHFYTCPAGVDASNPANWSTYTTLTLTP